MDVSLDVKTFSLEDTLVPPQKPDEGQ